MRERDDADARLITAARDGDLAGAAGLSYAGLTVLLTWQALRGQPVTAPDATTMIAAGIGLAVVLVAGLSVIGHAATTGRR